MQPTIERLFAVASESDVDVRELPVPDKLKQEKTIKPILIFPWRHKMVLPNGIIEISASLKCWRAKGIPMMVMVNSRPNTTCTNAV